MLLRCSGVALLLPFLLGAAVRAAPAPDGGGEEDQQLPELFSREEASLNEMFREVEELMEDTQYKLRNAVKEMEAEEESAKKPSEVDFEKLPPNYHNESNTDTKIGNKTIHTHQEIHKATDNKTGSTVYSETLITSINDGESKRNHECIIDEDCETGKYCQFSSFEYKCQLCKAQDMHCARDVECCGEQLCVWGQCMQAASKGENGTICENQQDCNAGMCCAFRKDLLFPVCTSLPALGEPCHDPSNQHLNLITWELEPDGGVLDRCPCANGLICQLQGYGTVSVCKASFNETQDNDKEEPMLMDEVPFIGLTPRDVLSYYEDSSILDDVRGNLEEKTLQQAALKELDMGDDPLFGDEI